MPVSTIYTGPLWVLFLIFVVPSAVLLLRDRHWSGHCPRCNYNLTGLPNAPCPECGRAP